MAPYAHSQSTQRPSSALQYTSANVRYPQYTAQNMSSAFVATAGNAQFAMNPMSLDTRSKSLTSSNPNTAVPYKYLGSCTQAVVAPIGSNRIDTTVPYKMNSAFVATTGDARFARNPISLDALSNSSPIGSSTSRPIGSLTSLSSMGSLPSESIAAQNLPAPQNSASLRQPIAKDNIQLVSLGCACGTKLAFQEMGRSAESLPFDSITTTSEGLLNFLRSGFQGFFNIERKAEKNVNGASITAFRSRQHGFWHDDPTQAATQEKYNRRFKRMQAISAHSQPVLFVRLAASSEEIGTVDQLLSQLISQFGPESLLLLIIDCQGANASGQCSVKGFDNLLIHYLNAVDGVNKFCEPIDAALDWAAAKPVRCVQVKDLADAQHLAVPVTPGYYGMGGMGAFEGIPE